MARKRSADPRPVAVFDLDGSFVREQHLALLVRELIARRLFSRRAGAEFKKLYKEFQDRKITFERYDRRLIELFSKHIVGKRADDVEQAAEAVADAHRDLLYTFSRTLLAELQPTHCCITITGAMQEIVSYLAPYWGFEQMYATELEVVRGRYTGRDLKVHFNDKERTLREHLAATGAGKKGMVALGDTLSDAPMLALAELPIAFNPNAALAAEAAAHGWPKVVERKDLIYVIESGRCREFHIDQAREAVRYLLDKAFDPQNDGER